MAPGRIAIKLGASRAPAPPSSLGKRTRNAALGSDSDSASDDEHPEAITGFGASGAETHRKPSAPKQYVIARQANRDWKADVKAQRQDAAAPSSSMGEPRQWGLSIKTKTSVAEVEEPEGQAKEPRTADQEALDALLNEDGTRIIPSEDDAYRRDTAQAGAASTLEDYEAMPVEEFGAALLRGMGWNGDLKGPQKKEVRRRQNHLGLGAKELQGEEDLGQWDQKGGRKRPRPTLADYRREENKRKEDRARNDSYKRERERERDGEREGRARDDDDKRERQRQRDRDRDREHERVGYRERGSERDRHRDDRRVRHRDRSRDKDRQRDGRR